MDKSMGLIFLVCLGCIFSCQVGTDNDYPQIDSIYAVPDTLEMFHNTTLYCVASDMNGDELTYIWDNKHHGLITGSGAQVTFTPESYPGTFNLDCWVLDGNGGAARDVVTITVAEPGLPIGAVAYYALDANCNDESGNGNHGAGFALSSQYSRSGMFRKAYSFDGQASYINVPDDHTLDITGAISISLWVKPDYNPVDAVGSILIKQHAAGHTAPYAKYGLFIFPDYGNWQFRIGNQQIFFGPVVTNTWQHIVVTFDASTQEAKCWIGGQIKAEASNWGEDIATSGYPLKIGTNAALSEYFKGSLDDIRIFDYVLTEYQISALQYETD